jgi:exopolysaccharide biosynthesis polyprenyl glycosylphosphotransferase
MLTNRASGLYRLHVGAQVCTVLCSFAGMHWLLNWLKPGGLTLLGMPYVSYGLIVGAALVGEAWTRPERLRWLLELSRRNLRRVSLRQFLAILLVLSVYLVSTQDHRISRRFFAAFGLWMLPLLHFTNAYFPSRLAKVVLRMFENKQANILIIEEQPVMAFFEDKIRSGIYPGMAVSGYITLKPPEPGHVASNRSWLGTLDNLEEVVEAHGISQIVMPSLNFEPAVGRELRAFCEAKGVRLVLVNDAPKRLGCRLTMTDIGGMEILSPRSEPLEDPLNQALKRAADIVFSAFVLVLVFPFTMLFAWICHRLQSPGPLFFRQERTGRGGASFSIVKFRTLHAGNQEEARQVSADDVRVFPLGRLMRKLSIDEIPQFWNVLLGDMSLVGPRPHIPAHDVKFADISENYLVRTFVKPGITGLAQVKGYRGETRTRAQVRNRTRWDVIYLERWTPALDIWIVLKTVIQVLRPPRGAA